MTGLRTYLLTIVAGAILVSFASVLFREGTQKKITSFVGGLILVLIVISPILQIKESQIAAVLSTIRLNAEELRTGVEITNREIQEMIISEQCAAYISDKALEFGAEVKVEIRMSDTGTVPYPIGVTLCGSFTPACKKRMISLIEQEFAIPEESQIWSEK